MINTNDGAGAGDGAWTRDEAITNKDDGAGAVDGACDSEVVDGAGVVDARPSFRSPKRRPPNWMPKPVTPMVRKRIA